MGDDVRLPRSTVLIVDDEEGVRESVRAVLEATCDVLEAGNGEQALDVLRGHDVDLVMLDHRMPGESGIDVLPRLKAADPSTVVVLATAVRDVRMAVEAMRRGAYDYLTKPFDVEEILVVVRRALEKRALEREVLSLRSALAEGPPVTAHGFEGMVGRHPEMVRIYRLIAQIADTPATVLITGESGTGKELIARAIHHQGPRRDQPFVAVNPAAIPETLIESELFGHEKGAFTGAHQRKLGRFELAQGGTLFLDEIATLRSDLQAKLLRVLQEREIERVGGTRAIKIDVRIIAATNADVPAAVSRGTFREDLYYRLNVVHIGVPPLRNRVDDIPLLVDHFVQRYVQESGKRIEGLTPETLGLLRGYRWPGNVRELQNVIERAVVLTDGPTIGVDDLPLELSLGVAHVLPEETLPLNEASDRFEQQMVLRALDRVHGNVSEAARMLGLHRNSLKAKLARWKIRARDLRSDAQ